MKHLSQKIVWPGVVDPVNIFLSFSLITMQNFIVFLCHVMWSCVEGPIKLLLSIQALSLPSLSALVCFVLLTMASYCVSVILCYLCVLSLGCSC